MARLAMGAADGMALQAVLDSFVQFAIAPAVARRCVYAVVCNTMPNDLEEFRSAFSYADRDADGLVSRTDLSAALSWAQAINLVDPDLLFAAADVNSSGLLDFRKFSAACLYSRLAPLDEWLAQQAFVSLDHDVDGRLTPHDVMAAFGFLPVGLPQHGDFGVQQWTSCVLGMVPGSGAEFADLSAVNNETSRRLDCLLAALLTRSACEPASMRQLEEILMRRHGSGCHLTKMNNQPLRRGSIILLATVGGNGLWRIDFIHLESDCPLHRMCQCMAGTTELARLAHVANLHGFGLNDARSFEG
eukprot:TRINITY_DN9467_c0_g1_i1.p1 TRINITY_DN9467_c0_g1~~TRINITY_DN9467_c0_g1_i1.p1  ORF type:complete len:302 (-),score=43.61 TRINITY_DN9467_c0_g1_i1:420-1325(-)